MKIFDMREIWEEETRGACGELVKPEAATEEENQRLRERVLGEMRGRNAAFCGKKRRFPVIAAAAACLFVLAACSAAAVFHWNGRLAKNLNLGEAEKTYAEKTGVAQTLEESSDTCSGVNVSLKQALATEDLCYLIFDVELPDSPAYFAEGAPIVLKVDADGLEGWSQPMTLSNHEDMSTEKNVLSMYMVGYFPEDAKERIPIRIRFKDMVYRTMYGPTTVRGTWELDCTLEKNTEKIGGETELLCDLPVHGGGTESRTLTEYKLTPLEAIFRFRTEFDDETAWALEDLTLTVYYKNGESVDIDCGANLELNHLKGWKDPDRLGYIFSYEICMDRIIDVEQVAALEFCGTMINVQG